MTQYTDLNDHSRSGTPLDVIDRKTGVGSFSAFTENDFPESFPYARWTQQLELYNEYWGWFTGSVWDETIPGAKNKAGNPVKKYPLGVNLIKSAAMKHNYVLFGEVPDGPDPLVPCRVQPLDDGDEDNTPTDAVKRTAKRIQNYVNRTWTHNNGRVSQLEGGLIGQFLGGTVFRLVWQPFEKRKYKRVKIEMILPDFFMPVWDSSDPDNLLEAFLVYRMPSREAFIKYGYTNGGNGPDAEFVLYVEHWSARVGSKPGKINIYLGGKPITQEVEATDEETGEVERVSMTFGDDTVDNPWDFVPFVYIPRERAGGYFGLSFIDDVKGEVREYNARLADIGDAIADTTHREIFLRNVNGQIRTKSIGAGSRVATDLGQTPPGQNTKEPDAFAIDPMVLPSGMSEFPDKLREQFMRDSFLSAVAEGEDEGSQRSALTLAFRMWPLTSKGRAVRAYWSQGLSRLNWMIAYIAAVNEEDDFTVDDLDEVSFHSEWSPQVPRDREQQVAEVMGLMQGKGLSPLTALQILSTVPDPSAELQRVKEWLTWLNNLLIEQAKAAGDAKMNGSGDGDSKKQSNGGTNEGQGTKTPSALSTPK